MSVLPVPLVGILATLDCDMPIIMTHRYISEPHAHLLTPNLGDIYYKYERWIWNNYRKGEKSVSIIKEIL